MAFKAPDEFDFSIPSGWPAWRDRWQRFRLASKLHKEAQDVQVSALIYSMGPTAEYLLTSFALSDDEKKKLDPVIEELNSYFQPKTNIIAQRHRFETRNQMAGESNESFIRSVLTLAQKCDFGDTRSERIRDRLISGMMNKELSRKIQIEALETEITLEKVITMLRSCDLVDQVEHTPDVDSVSRNVPQQRHQQFTPQQQRHHQQQQRPRQQRQFVPQQQRQFVPQHQRNQPRPVSSFQQHPPGNLTCRYCGGRCHLTPQQCPALGKTCFHCNGRDHFASVCIKKRVHDVQLHDDQCVVEPQCEGAEADDLFLGEVKERQRKDEWILSVDVGQNPVTFKVDSGADVNVMSLQQFKQLQPRPVLQPAQQPISSVGGALEVVGVFQEFVKHKQVSLDQELFYVVDTSQNLLSRDTSMRLGVIAFTGDVKLSDKLFGATGMMKTDPIKIKLVENAVPSAVHTARNVPFPLLKPVQKELERMEAAGIIKPVTEPTDWCAPMVPVPKSKPDSVRITVDYKHLNRSVKREVFPIPTAEQLTAQLAGSTLYSKLDASSGFYQLPLEEESQLLTTFLTPFGRKAFTRLPMGINLAPECFQRKMEEMLKDLTGVVCYMDDIVVFGDDSTHDKRLQEVLDRIEASGLKLNRSKCEFRKTSISFLGQKISRQGIQADPDKVAAIGELKAPENEREQGPCSVQSTTWASLCPKCRPS